MPKDTGFITTVDMLACALRELKMRKKVYPRLVKAHTMTVEDAVWERECMKRIVQGLEKMVQDERGESEPVYMQEELF